MTVYWPNSPLLQAVRKLRRMVALSAAFQARSGLSYDDIHDQRVWTEYVPGQDELIRETQNPAAVAPVMPFATIWPISFGSHDVAGGSQVAMLPDGILHLYIAVQPLDTILDWNERREEAIGFLDQVVQDVAAVSGANDAGTTDGAGHLTIRKLNTVIIDHVPFKHHESAGDHFYKSVAVTYGDDT